MQITHEINGTVGLVALTGKLDFNCRKTFLSTIENVLQQPIGQIVLDLSHVPFMDSAGLALLTESSRRAKAINMQIFIIHPQPYILDLFALTHMDQHVTYIDSIEEALRSTPCHPNQISTVSSPQS